MRQPIVPFQIIRCNDLIFKNTQNFLDDLTPSTRKKFEVSSILSAGLFLKPSALLLAFCPVLYLIKGRPIFSPQNVNKENPHLPGRRKTWIFESFFRFGFNTDHGSRVTGDRNKDLFEGIRHTPLFSARRRVKNGRSREPFKPPRTRRLDLVLRLGSRGMWTRESLVDFAVVERRPGSFEPAFFGRHRPPGHPFG